MRHTAIAAALFAACVHAPVMGQIPGRNVNMVSGTRWPTGDPFLQRQNEPSMAVSSRNSRHLLAGANDYRTVDLPGLPAGRLTGDAWLGVFTSIDGGQSWKSTLLPGCPQDVPECNGAPVLKGYAAGADPVVRAGTNGLFYYAGIVFDREENGRSLVFVSRFIDNNNEESGDPIKFVSVTPVDRASGALFVDKPWIATDIPRPGSGTCTIPAPGIRPGERIDQTVPAGNVYIAYTVFADEERPPSRILFSRSTDCGATFSQPVQLAGDALHQGASIAIDPASGTVYVAWRRFRSEGIADAILIARSTDGGRTFTQPQVVAQIAPFDQGTSNIRFRTNSYPTMAVDGFGRIYLAWAERGFGLAADSRIVLATSRNGQNWTARQPVDQFAARGHQFMPAMAFAGGRLTIIYYDLREDHTFGIYNALGGGRFLEQRRPAGDLATLPPNPAKVFTEFLYDAAPPDLNDGHLLRRHTLDVRVAQADPADVPAFGSARVSQYIFGSRSGSSLIEQMQVNPPNFPLFRQGTAPFIGDYLDVAASPTFLPGDAPGTWKFNTDQSRATVFHAVWTDNRDVRPPSNGDWTTYTPPVSASTRSFSIFDPTRPQPACVTGREGMRNQNIYTARLTQGLALEAPSNSKALSNAVQRAFVVVVQNTTTAIRTFRLRILNQPAGGKASFLQFPVGGFPDPLLTLDVRVAANSSASRTVFVTSVDPRARVRVRVDEIAATNSAEVLRNGLQGTVDLNPDPLNPANPDIANVEVFNPDIANPDIANPDIANPDIANPDIANPDIANPDIANPDIANPDIANPDIANPDIANPDIANPDIANPDIANGAISDATWKVSNRGNTTAVYSIRLLLSTTVRPDLKWQLIVHKPYNNPLSKNCNLVEKTQSIILANIINPRFQTQQTLQPASTGARAAAAERPAGAPERTADITDDTVDNATVPVGPGDTVYVTLRIFNPDRTRPLGFDIARTITVVTTSHAANTGQTQPPSDSSNLSIVTASLPAGVAGRQYSAAIAAAGGQPPYFWSIRDGSLPPGVGLGAEGRLTGIISPEAIGLYSFVLQVRDAAGRLASQPLSILVTRVGLTIASVTAGGTGGSAIVLTGGTIVVGVTVANSGSLASSVAPAVTVSSTGTASVACSPPSPRLTNIAPNASQPYAIVCGPATGVGTLIFNATVQGIDAASGQPIRIGPVASPPVTVSAGF